MFEIRLHGRGGQGVVTAAELIAVAAFSGGKFSQAFPFFGVERRGAPIEAFCRIDDRFIRLRQHIYHPTHIVILDPTLLGIVDVLKGAQKKAQVLINSEETIDSLIEKEPALKKFKVITVPATKIALYVLSKPIINTAMLGAFATSSGLIELDAVKKAIVERFEGRLGEMNVKAAEEGWRSIKN